MSTKNTEKEKDSKILIPHQKGSLEVPNKKREPIHDSQDEDESDSELKLQEQPEELSGGRLVVGNFIRGRCFDIFIIILIVVYTLLVVVTLVLEDEVEGNEDARVSLLTIELVILGIFCFEISLSLYVYHCKYFKDLWNVLDAVVILISIAFVLIDLMADPEGALGGLLKMRALFRLVRIFILMRKMSVIQTKKIKFKIGSYDFKTPVERVLEILNSLKLRVPGNEATLQSDLNWCTDIISSNKLYDTAYGDNSDKPEEVRQWLDYGGETRARSGSIALGRQDSKLSGDKAKEAKGLPRQRSTFAGLSMKGHVKEHMKGVEDINFDIFKLEEMTEGDALVTMGYFLMDKMGLINEHNVNEQVLVNFLKRIQSGYNPNPYHNKTHAADITQTCHFLLTTCAMKEVCDINELELLCMVIAPLIHDFEHNGLTNVFHTNNSSELALRYNDDAVLESHHVSATYVLLQESRYNIFDGLIKEDKIMVRKLIISMVLHTDMAKHFGDIASFKVTVSGDKFDAKGADKHMLIRHAMHMADIGNQGKPYHLCRQWTDNLFREFFMQGDKERAQGVNISMLMDRATVNIAKSQQGFIDFIVFPTFNPYVGVVEKASVITDMIQSNKETWVTKIEEYEAKKIENEHLVQEMLEKEVEDEDQSEGERKSFLTPKVDAPVSDSKDPKDSTIVERRTSKTNKGETSDLVLPPITTPGKRTNLDAS